MSILASMAAIIGGGRNAVTLREYIDRGLGDLAKYHDATVNGIQAEIDRRLGEIQRETNTRLDGQAKEATALKDRAGDAADRIVDRLDKLEQVIDRQRGRQAAYASLATLAGVILTLLILLAAHVSLH